MTITTRSIQLFTLAPLWGKHDLDDTETSSKIKATSMATAMSRYTSLQPWCVELRRSQDPRCHWAIRTKTLWISAAVSNAAQGARRSPR